MSQDNPVILFDGVCNLCNGSVQFVIRRDKDALFRFASLQSNSGQALLRQYGLPENTFNSFVLIDGGKTYTKSSAALRVAKKMRGGWRLLYGLMIVPKFIRDGIYNLIARNRYRWFGKKDACMIPTPALKSRFLD